MPSFPTLPTSRPVHLERSRSYPCGVKRAFDTVLPVPLTEILGHRTGPLPGIVDVGGQTGDWSTPGQTHTIVLADRSTAVETLTAVERPGEFRYAITGVTGPMTALVGRIEGRWAFEPVGTGVRITWSWELTPRSRAAGTLMPVVTRAWHGWAGEALERLESVLLPPRFTGSP